MSPGFAKIHSWLGGLAPDRITRKVLNMTDVNYTPEMVATIEAAQPLDLAKAKALGAQLDRGYRSIIAKAKREGFEYISKPAPARKKPHHLKLNWWALLQKLLIVIHLTD